MIPWLRPGDPPTAFPPVETALEEPDGLLCAGGDLSPERLLEAYRRGIFPWFSAGQPILWWSPDPRMVLFTDELKVSRSLAKSIRNKGYELRFDTAFGAVLEGCAAPRSARDADAMNASDAGTWLGAPMRAAYTALHDAGYAHSVETWRDGALVGGLYGVALGRMFYGESMFARETDASKVALVRLVTLLHGQGVPLIDCQQETQHLATLGAKAIPRTRFAAILRELIHSAAPPPGWHPGAQGSTTP